MGESEGSERTHSVRDDGECQYSQLINHVLPGDSALLLTLCLCVCACVCLPNCSRVSFKGINTIRRVYSACNHTQRNPFSTHAKFASTATNFWAGNKIQMFYREREAERCTFELAGKALKSEWNRCSKGLLGHRFLSSAKSSLTPALYNPLFFSHLPN